MLQFACAYFPADDRERYSSKGLMQQLYAHHILAFGVILQLHYNIYYSAGF